jgi:transposase-like protein DUF772
MEASFMMGRQEGDQSQLFYLFNLEERVPVGLLLRRINPLVRHALTDLREGLVAFYSRIGRPSIDPELMIRMLIVGYCYGIRSERRLPLRQRSSFQPNSLEVVGEVLQHRRQPLQLNPGSQKRVIAEFINIIGQNAKNSNRAYLVRSCPQSFDLIKTAI